VAKVSSLLTYNQDKPQIVNVGPQALLIQESQLIPLRYLLSDLLQLNRTSALKRILIKSYQRRTGQTKFLCNNQQ
jgi:hypothetical protein